MKFNPYHDPDDGRFTFAPGNPGVLPPRKRASSSLNRNNIRQATFDTARDKLRSIRTNARSNPRARTGGNSRAFNDPLVLEQAFPGLRTAPGGSIIALADNLLDIAGPAQRMTSELSLRHSQVLIAQIQRVDPNYHFQSLGFPETLEGQAIQIKNLRMDRAVALFRIRNELRPLQVETLKFLQARTDAAYAEGVARYNAGRLQPRLNREEAIGNFVDRRVRDELRDMLRNRGISISRDSPVRVNSRASSSADGSYTVPDSRVGQVAFDVTLTQKTNRTPQVSGFFRSDFQPGVVIIVRPSVFGTGSTCAIKRP